MADDPQSHWSLDKRVPLALILTIALQTASAVWWASGVSGQLEGQARRIDAIEAQKVESRLSRLEEGMSGVRTQLDRIESKLDRIGNYPSKP